MKLRIILADDHPTVRIGIRAAIESTGAADVIAEANTTDELLSILAQSSCDVLVTDYSMPGGSQPDGLALIKRIRRSYPDLPIVLFTMTSNLGLLRNAAATGIHGFVDKGAPVEQLITAIRAAHRGALYVSEALRERLFDTSTDRNEILKTVKLSPKEEEVLRMLADGMTPTEIANKLHRSVTTISRQKHNAMKRLSLKNDAELFEYLASRD